MSATVPATISGDGISVVILGNRSTCSLCQSLWGGLDVAALSAALCGANVIDADKTDANKLYQAFAPADGFQTPLVRVYEGGVLKGEFVSRNDLPPALFEKIKALTAGCK